MKHNEKLHPAAKSGSADPARDRRETTADMPFTQGAGRNRLRAWRNDTSRQPGWGRVARALLVISAGLIAVVIFGALTMG